MSNPTFSIIVPAHNASGYIRKLLDSIDSQSFRDFELIVICDDCSDDTKSIAKEYGAITCDVSFHRDGLSRDTGLDIASGQWILFADDDDWFIHDYCFQELAKRTASTTCDAIPFGIIFRTRGYIPPSVHDFLRPRIDHVWSTCWRRSAVEKAGARFGDAVFSSDTYFLAAMKRYKTSFELLDMPIYYYNFLRPGSQTDLFCKGIIRQSPVAE